MILRHHLSTKNTLPQRVFNCTHILHILHTLHRWANRQLIKYSKYTAESRGILFLIHPHTHFIHVLLIPSSPAPLPPLWVLCVPYYPLKATKCAFITLHPPLVHIHTSSPRQADRSCHAPGESPLFSSTPEAFFPCSPRAATYSFIPPR